MDNNQENQDEIFKMSDSSSSNGFKKVSASTSSAKSPEYVFKKSKVGFGKGVLLPFASGIIGAGITLGVCFGVPAIKDKIISKNSNNSKTSIVSYKGETENTIDTSDYSGTAISVANKVLPSVVGIEVQFSVTPNVPSYYSITTPSATSKATGSGVIISDDGYILTNNHIIDSSSSSNDFYEISSANKVLVYLYGKDEPVEAKIIGADSVTDLAILKIEADDLTPAELGDSDSIKVGEFAMAIGNPLNMSNTVTSGIISGLNREITDTDGTSYTLIQTDAAINAGNSGGALVNADGKVIGINTMKLAGTGIEGMGFAIPINSTVDITDQLITYKKVKRPHIGISGQSVPESYTKYYNIPQGVLIKSIENDGPAKDSELKEGDIITKINDTIVTSMTELNNVKNKLNIGDTVKLTVYRSSDDSTKEIEIKLAEEP